MTRGDSRSGMPQRWMHRVVPPASTLLVLLLFAGFALQSQHAREQESVAQLATSADQIAARIQVLLDDHEQIIDRLAATHAESEAAFTTRAQFLVDIPGGFRAINWIGAEHVVTIAESVQEHDRDHLASGFVSASVHRNAVRRALDQGITTRTPFTGLVHGGGGFSIYKPMQAGVLNAVFSLDALVSDAVPEVRSDPAFLIAVLDGDEHTAVLSTGDLEGPGSSWRQTRRIDFLDRPLTLVLQPRSAPRTPPQRLFFQGLAALILGLGFALVLREYFSRVAQLQAQQDQARRLIDSFHEGLIRIDPSGRTTLCNQAALRALETNPDRIGESLDGLSWVTAQRERAALLASIQEGRPWSADRLMARSLSGREFPVGISAQPIEEDGRHAGALITFRDITSEIESMTRVNQLMTLFEAMPDTICLADASGTLTYVNPAGRQLTDIGEQHPRNFNVLAFMMPRTLEEILHEVHSPEGRGRVWQGETELIRWSGERVPVSAIVMQEADAVGSDFYAIVLRDLRAVHAAEAERRSLEAQFRDAQRLESLGLLAGSVAHDFNNMLAGILGHASVAIEHIDDHSPALESVQQVALAAERAADLTGQLLAYSGRGRFKTRTVDLRELVREMSSLLRTSISRRVELDLRLDTPAVVEADPTQIRQVVLNLITNAAQAIDGTGQVGVTLGQAHVDPAALTGHKYSAPRESGNYAILEVRDNGIGMPAGVVAHIFEPFFTTREDGRGLGLAAVLGVVRGHNGFLHLQTTPGEGSRFQIYLPASLRTADSSPEGPTSAGASDAAAVEGKVILLIDDEPAVRNYVKTALELLGLQVIACEDGLRGVEAFRDRHEEIDAVMIDQSMPGLSGDAAWSQMQDIATGIPAILMSGYDAVAINESLETLGFSGFLQKPFAFQALKDTLLPVLGAED